MFGDANWIYEISKRIFELLKCITNEFLIPQLTTIYSNIKQLSFAFIYLIYLYYLSAKFSTR